MSDFPTAAFHKPIISVFAPESLGIPVNAWVQGVPSTGPFPAANLALYVPFALSAPYLLTKMWWINGTTAAGNVDAGVFSLGGTKLWSTGTQAQSGASAIQSFANTDIFLPPDLYYMAIATDSATSTFFRIAPAAALAQLCGVLEQASAFTLPTTATFAQTTRTYVPTFGISSTSVI